MTAPTPLNTPLPGFPTCPTPPANDNSETQVNTQWANTALGVAIGPAVAAALADQKSLGLAATAPTENGTVATTPPSSATIQTALGDLSLGSAWHNSGDYDVWLTVYLGVTVNTSLVVKDGVGTSDVPVQTTIITGTSATGIVPIRARVPAGQYRLLSVSGTETSAIVGQYLEAA